MTERFTEERRASFDHNAERYDAIRPSYPEAMVEHLLGATTASYLVEVGAGTGKATVMFAKREECSLVAIEPGPKLAKVLRRNVTPFPNVTIAETTFEAWPIEACDLVFAAQSWHWVDPTKRYLKAVRASPALAIISNEKAPFESAVRAELAAAYDRWWPGGDPERIQDAVEIRRREQTEEIDRTRLYGAVEVTTFPWRQAYTSREYISLLGTYTDHATLEDARRLPLFEAIEQAIDRLGGSLTIPYVSMVFLARRR